MTSAADKFARVAALRPASPGLVRRPAPLRDPGAEDSFARLTGAGVARNRFGEHLALRQWFSTPEFATPSRVALELLSRTRDESVSRRTRAALENPDKWLFLDTETTGLAGGTGTYPFLVGIAWWDAGALQIEQLFMRDFSEEHSLLHELAARLAERPVLVTFNGKSFDWPLLESRFIMTRSIAAPRLAAHLDLLHPARALWKLRLGGVRLVELEQQVLDARRLGWQRDDDIASALIPQYYFDYLRGGSCDQLIGVMRHNQMDLRGLAALFGKINSLLSAEETERNGEDSRDLLGLSRYLHRRGDSHRAHDICSQAIGLGLPREVQPRARRELAHLAKRRGNHDTAAKLWRELTEDSQDGAYACEQLAIHYERREKDLAQAAEFATLGLAKARRICTQTRDAQVAARGSRLAEKLLMRVRRLETRLSAERGTNPSSSLPY